MNGYRPEKFVLSPGFAALLEGRGERLEVVVHHADGTASLELGPADDPEEEITELDALTASEERELVTVLARQIIDGELADCDCPDCRLLAERDWQRQRLISRLKTRMLALGGHLCDEFHPWGRCTCGGQGACAWCESTCLSCGGAPHEGDCPELEAVLGSARVEAAVTEGPSGYIRELFRLRPS